MRVVVEALPIDVRLGRKPTLDMLYGVVDIAAVVVDVLVGDGTPRFWEEVKLQYIYSGMVVFSTTASRRYGNISR